MKKVILKQFPNHTGAIYYTPSHQSNVPRGKLYSAYTHYRRLLGSVKLIKLRPKGANARAPNLTSSIISEDKEDLTSKMDWLETNAGPFEEGLKYWEETRLERFKILHNSQISTHAYLEKFPILDTVNGFKLVNIFKSVKHNVYIKHI